MKILVEVSSKNNLYLDKVDGIILPLEKYSVESICYFSLDEIIEISKESCEVFVKINKNLSNSDILEIKEILLKLNQSNIKGILFYDLAILQLKNELNLSVDLVWNQTHMVNNYKTCDYYYSKGVKYAVLGKEITLEEVIEIINKSKITSMVEVISKPSVAFSKRKLISNYSMDSKTKNTNQLVIKEKVTDTFYKVIEDDNGTTFYQDTITNGTSIIRDLFQANCKYIIIKEFGLEDIMNSLLIDTKKYVDNKCLEKDYVDKYKVLGDNTNFFFKKTIYRVKKDEKN